MACGNSNIRTVILVIFMIGYLLLGAGIFMVLERHWEKDTRELLIQTLKDFRAENTCVDDAELEEFIAHIIRANNRGVSALRNASGDPNWTFGPSLFFAGTILTTIGYGHVTPLSEGGKVFCIVYAAIGIPLTLIMFTALVERLMILTTKLKQFLCNKLGHLYKAVHIRLIHVCIIFLFLITFVFLIPAAVFMTLEENWNYLDAFYYCFISMTTIGLGDYIPGDDYKQPHRQLYKILTTIYLFTGLVFMMLTLANVYDVPELNIGYHFYMKSDEEEEPSEGERTSLRNASDTKAKYAATTANTTSLGTSQDNAGYQGDNTSQKGGEKTQLTSSQ